jgi:hypothetical protein
MLDPTLPGPAGSWRNVRLLVGLGAWAYASEQDDDQDGEGQRGRGADHSGQVQALGERLPGHLQQAAPTRSGSWPATPPPPPRVSGAAAAAWSGTPAWTASAIWGR